jgi:hypothetical protein
MRTCSRLEDSTGPAGPVFPSTRILLAPRAFGLHQAGRPSTVTVLSGKYTRADRIRGTSLVGVSEATSAGVVGSQGMSSATAAAAAISSVLQPLSSAIVGP